MSEVKYLPNGTATFQNTNGETLYQCRYCESWFMPKRRFMQKYCTESCRVMACRNRKKGLYGVMSGNSSSRNKTTNTELYNIVDDLRAEIKDIKEKNYQDSKVSDVKLDLIKKTQEKIRSNQQWHIFISCTMPVIAPKLAEGIASLFKTKDPKNMEQFRKEVDPILESAPKELKNQILSVTKVFFENQKKNNANSV